MLSSDFAATPTEVPLSCVATKDISQGLTSTEDIRTDRDIGLH